MYVFIPTPNDHIPYDGFPSHQVASKLIHAFSYQLFTTGFVHGDPHPGNVFIRPSRLGGAEIVLLDHGLYTPLHEGMRQSLCTIFKSIIFHDVPTLKEECGKLGVDNYEIFSVILTGRSLSSHKELFGKSDSKMTTQDWSDVKNTFFQFDKIMEVLRILPSSMILCLRYVYII